MTSKKQPNYTDFWARTGKSYVPAVATDVAATIARARQEQQHRAGEDPLDHSTWPADQQPPEPLGRAY